MGNLRFADDIAVLAEEEVELQDSVDIIAPVVKWESISMQKKKQKTKQKYIQYLP